MKILITGGGGYLGRTLTGELSKNHQVTSINRSHLNLIDFEQVKKYISFKDFDYIIHTASKGGRRDEADNALNYFHNMKMFLNLSHFQIPMFIFGSGAEFKLNKSFYGQFKFDVCNIIQNTPHVYQLRLWGCFGNYEEPQRFIKNNITKYISGSPITIHNDIKMDFFYDKDITTILEGYFNGEITYQFLNLCYNQTYKLSEIADKINKLSQHHTSPIDIMEVGGEDYYCKFNKLPTSIESKLLGLDKGIKQLYDSIKKN